MCVSETATIRGEAMLEFESVNQYWDFSHYVRRTARHVLDAKNRQFLDTVLATSQKRRTTVPNGTRLWCAQLGNNVRTEAIPGDDGEVCDSVDVEIPYHPDRMIPRIDRANEGRVNPKGIPCLYCSTEMETAMTEVRPWIGSYVSVGEFVVQRDLTCVDCTLDFVPAGVIYPFGEPEPSKREAYLWGQINRAFSEPVTLSDDVADYAPTQVLAEAFHIAGYDAIKYGSKLGTGKTVAIFDLTAAKQRYGHLFKVESISVAYLPENRSYRL